MIKNSMYIFVYGTLMTGFYNYEKYLSGKVFSRKVAYVKGKLFHLNNKGYPAFVKEGGDKVYGEVLEIPNDKNLINELDDLESSCYEDKSKNEYIKECLIVYDMKGEVLESLPVYVYNEKAKNNIGDDKLLLKSGDWRAYMELEEK